MGFFYLGGLELAMVLEDITQNGSKHRNIASRISGSVDSNVILQNIHTFYKEAITTQFITYQATFTPSAITVHSTENLVDNLFEAIPANHTCQYHIYKIGKAAKTYLGGVGI